MTVEQRSGKWYSTSHSDPQPPKMRMIYKPHRSKVKGENKANLFRIKVRTLGCALGISQECDIAATPDQQL